jgi:hypothetical protein
MGRASGRKGRRATADAGQGELPVSPPPLPPLPPLPPEPPEFHSRAHRRRLEETRDYPAALGLLQVAVPLWVDRFRPMTWEERMKVRDQCLGIIGCDTDAESIALFVVGTAGKPGQIATAFNAVAQALALGALQPGGVHFCGMHFEAAP